MANNIGGLVGKAREYLPPDKVDPILEAYRFADEAHRGQLRLSGTPYIQHPLEVANVLADLHLDGSTIASALLHDVVEDCGVSSQDIQRRFGDEVAKLVEGVTKLGQIATRAAEGELEARTNPSLQAESLRKMLVAMAEDVRVILIKLADRLHNMRTIQALPPEKRMRIAQETLDIYAPLAHRLGIASVQWQLEDLAFRTLQPDSYRAISRLLATSRAKREAFMDRVVGVLKVELEKVNLEAEVTGRAKHIYSIHRKMERYASVGRDFDQIYDLIALRVLVADIRACYASLGVVHSVWHPIRGEFDDYIANPRENMYQSLHTSVLGPDVSPLEVQIRTYRMHEIADYGVAAHWRYKEKGDGDHRFDDQLTWMRQLLDWHTEDSGAEDFLETVKSDIFQDQVFVYTPKGEIREMPAGATPIDFAYGIHTELGHGCVGAKVNGTMVSLDHELQNGDTVEIISKRGKGPSLDWLNSHLGYVKTANARGKIKHWFRRRAREENVHQGRALLEKELRRLHVQIREESIAELLSFESVEDLLAALGSGALSSHQLAPKLLAPTGLDLEEISLRPITDAPPTVKVLGMLGLHARLAECCSPVLKEPIIGFVTRSRGVTVHRKDCPNFRQQTQKERFVDVEWAGSGGHYPAKVAIEAWDRVGLLRDITTVVSSEKVNIAAVQSTHHKDGKVTERLTVLTKDAGQLSRLLSKLESVKEVIRVERDG